MRTSKVLASPSINMAWLPMLMVASKTNQVVYKIRGWNADVLFLSGFDASVLYNTHIIKEIKPIVQLNYSDILYCLFHSSIVCRHQTMVCSGQTMVWWHQTMVCSGQTIISIVEKMHRYVRSFRLVRFFRCLLWWSGEKWSSSYWLCYSQSVSISVSGEERNFAWTYLVCCQSIIGEKKANAPESCA